MPLPIIRFEVEGMKYSLLTALTEHQAKMDADIKYVVEEFCKSENLEKTIRKLAWEALNSAVQAEVHNFFMHGEGRKAVAAAVKESILNKETYTLLDEVDEQTSKKS